MAKINPLATIISLLLSSIAISFFAPLEAFFALALISITPFIFRVNILKILWKMKVMVITAILIFVFSIMAGKETITALSDSVKFLSVIALAALYIQKSDLMDLSSTLGYVLSPILGKRGWGFASSLMMTLALFPIIITSSSEMISARKSREGSFLRHPLSSLTDYTVSIMRLLFQKVQIFQDAMYSRSWSPSGRRTPISFTLFDWIYTFSSIILFVGFVLWKKMS